MCARQRAGSSASTRTGSRRTTHRALACVRSQLDPRPGAGCDSEHVRPQEPEFAPGRVRLAISPPHPMVVPAVDRLRCVVPPAMSNQIGAIGFDRRARQAACPPGLVPAGKGSCRRSGMYPKARLTRDSPSGQAASDRQAVKRLRPRSTRRDRLHRAGAAPRPSDRLRDRARRDDRFEADAPLRGAEPTGAPPVETNRPVDAIVAAQHKPDGGRTRLVSNRISSKHGRRPCIGTQSRLLTSQSSVSGCRFASRSGRLVAAEASVLRVISCVWAVRSAPVMRAPKRRRDQRVPLGFVLRGEAGAARPRFRAHCGTRPRRFPDRRVAAGAGQRAVRWSRAMAIRRRRATAAS